MIETKVTPVMPALNPLISSKLFSRQLGFEGGAENTYAIGNAKKVA
jgi:hypothetical protein